MYRYGYHIMAVNPGFPFGGLIGLIFWILLISLVVGLLVHLLSGKFRSTEEEEIEHAENALSILKMRYAKGEISKKEFLEIKKDIA